MSFSADEIAEMLMEYEADHHTGMQVNEICGWIYDYTSGSEKVASYPDLSDMLQTLLFSGKSITYNYYEPAVNIATVFGLVRNEKGTVSGRGRAKNS